MKNALIYFSLICLLGLSSCSSPEIPPLPEEKPLYRVSFDRIFETFESVFFQCAAEVPSADFLIAPSVNLPEAEADAILRLGLPETEDRFYAEISSLRLLVVYHPSNLSALRRADLIEIFSGRSQNWAKYGHQGEIHVVVPPPGSIAGELFQQQFLGGMQFSNLAQIVPSGAQVLETVQLDPQAIGFLTSNWLESGGIKELEIDLTFPVLVETSALPEGPLAEWVACLQSGN